MEKCKVLGVKHVSFMNEATGEQVTGSQLWLGAGTVDEAWNDYEVFKVWFPEGNGLKGLVDSLTHGTIVNVRFDRRGKKVLALTVED